MAWYYDLVVLAILALCVWNGMRKGVSRSLLQTAATILSTVVALWVSQPLAELCYTGIFGKAGGFCRGRAAEYGRCYRTGTNGTF